MSIAQLPSHDRLRSLGAVMLERFHDFLHRRATTFELEQAGARER